MPLLVNNLATPLPPFFNWHRDIKQIKAIGKFLCLILPFILGKSWWSGENPSGKSLPFCASIFTPGKGKPTLKFTYRLWGIVWIVLMSPFSWQGQNLRRLTLVFVKDWRVVKHIKKCKFRKYFTYLLFVPWIYGNACDSAYTWCPPRSSNGEGCHCPGHMPPDIDRWGWEPLKWIHRLWRRGSRRPNSARKADPKSSHRKGSCNMDRLICQ